MIIGVGTDLAPVARLAETLARQGARFTERCFADSERHYVEQAAAGNADIAAAGYAKRWAAKEACAKALGLGIRDGIYLRDIVIANDSAGKPSILLEGGAAARLSSLVPKGHRPRLDVSLSDDGGMALAFVVISADKEPQDTN